MLVHTHACIHAGENSKHDLYSIRKTPEIFTVQQRLRVYNMLTILLYNILTNILTISQFLPSFYNILELSRSLNLPNYAKIILYIQCGVITGCKILLILLCSLNILKCACVM